MKKNIKECIYMILENVDNFKELEEEIYQLVCSMVIEKIKEPPVSWFEGSSNKAG